MTNRELVQMAMPLTSLSEQEWNILNEYLTKVSGNQIYTILNTLKINQSRLEVMSNYFDAYGDILDEQIRQCSVQLQAV